MALHTTSPIWTTRAAYFALPPCPQCGDAVLAPEMSEHVNERQVRHRWACDACGHEFETLVDPFRARQ